MTPHWSPGGSYLLLEEQDDYGLVVVDAVGRQVGSYDGYLEPTWLTDDEFVAYKQSTMPSNPRQHVDAPAMFVHAGDRTTGEVSFPCCDALGNGRGAAAVSWFLPDVQGVPQPQFSVWSDETVTDPQPGFPIVWSPAGDALVVAHPYQQGHSADGWMEAFGWPGLATILEGDGTTTAALIARFSPSGADLAPTSAIDTNSGRADYLGVLSLATEHVTAIPTSGNHTSFAWEAQDDILVSDDASLSVYSADGRKLRSVPAPLSDEVVLSSTDGSKVVLFGSDDFLSVWPSGDTIALPVIPNGNTRVYLSPNGKALLLLSDAGNSETRLP